MIESILNNNLKIACVLIIVLTVYVLIKFRNTKYNVSLVSSATPVSKLAFSCILFTSGLDIGLIMFPLMEFNKYKNPEYLGINPLSVEIGFWGGAVWIFYFLTTFYFAYIEVKVKLFENNKMKFILALLMLLTCAFTANLFVIFFKFYFSDFSVELYQDLFTHTTIVMITVGLLFLSTLSALKVRFIKILSYFSIFLFIVLVVIGVVLNITNKSAVLFLSTLSLGIFDYIKNIYLFVIPMNEHHQFYMFWWFSWSLMIGKFVASFVPNGMTPIGLFILMLVVPTALLAIWFTVLYLFSLEHNSVPIYYFMIMSIVGLLFIVNSFDSILRVSADLVMKSTKLKKYNYALSFSYLLLVIFFIGYTGFISSSEGFIKIDYTGTLAIFIIYYMLYNLIKQKFKRGKYCNVI
ncbi:MAG TPA: hypothetical protein ACHBZ9_19960 [Arsenophonus nasoniae]|uniref:hypothetical protein n=1 Tax=Arsenophonus nasoniae TaxID=638 RepID=UPI003879FBB5